MASIQASDGTDIHVKDMGTGPRVILIHGWPLKGDMFEYQTLALIESGFRVITYDRPQVTKQPAERSIVADPHPSAIRSIQDFL